MSETYGNSYGKFDDLNEFYRNREIGWGHVIIPDYGFWMSDFYADESAQIAWGRFAEEFFEADPEDNPQGYDDADFALETGSIDIEEVDTPEFVAVLMPDVEQDPYDEEGIYGVYAASQEWWESNSYGGEYDAVSIDTRGQTYQDALQAAREMFDGIKPGNEYGITKLNLYDTYYSESDTRPIDSKELAQPESV